MALRKKRRNTVADLCAVTGYTRDQMHGLLRVLPMYARSRGAERVARLYDRQDLLTITAVVRLESKLGVSRTAIARIIDKIYVALGSPRPKNTRPFLRISINPPAVSYPAKSQFQGEGTVIALGPVFQDVDSYLLGERDDRLHQDTSHPNQPLVVVRRNG